MPAFTFCRIRPGIEDPDAILIDRASLDYSPVRIGKKRIADLYIKRVERHTPPWLFYFGASVDLSGISLKTASLAAVLLLRHEETLFAVVFGYGRSLLQDGVAEERFGLRATLNAVEPSQLRSIDHKRLEAVQRHTREQLSRAGGLDQFGLDVDRDLLRAVTGAPTDPKHGRRLSGADFLTVVGDIPLASLGQRLSRYAALSDATTYSDHFPWVDNIRQVRDPVLRAKLDAKLVAMIKSSSDDVWLAIPDIIDWSTTRGVRYESKKAAVVYPELSFDGYFEQCGTRTDFTEGRLTQDRVYLVGVEEDTAQRSWSLLRCLVAECKHASRHYILNEGQWYQIDQDFLTTVETFMQNVPLSQIPLPKYSDKDEGAYNKRVAASDKQRFALLDQNFVKYPQRGKVEVCDLYTKTREFIHVKRRGASSTLSHLFSQGTVAAQLMLAEPGFRKQFHAKLPPTHHWGTPDEQIEPSDFEVCFALINPPKKSLCLPFFSKVSLRTAVRNLTQLGFRVSIANVDSD